MNDCIGFVFIESVQDTCDGDKGQNADESQNGEHLNHTSAGLASLGCPFPESIR